MRFFKNSMKKVLLSVLVILIFLVIAPCNMIAQEDNQQGNRQIVDRIAAVVGNQIIMLSDVRTQLRNLMIAKNMDNNTSENVLQSLLYEVLQDMINEQLLLVKAAQDSIEVDLQQVDILEKQRLAEIRSNYTPEQLEELGLTEQQLRYMVRESTYNYVLTQTIADQIRSTISVTPQDMEAWLIAKRDSLPEMPEQFKLSHILLYPEVSDKKKEETKEKLQTILKRIREKEDFAELAGTYSQDPGTAADGGDIGYFTRETMLPEFSDAAFSLNVGEVSDIVETQLGFHIIKVEDIKGDQIRARHILFLSQPEAEDEERIINQLKKFSEDIVSGEATFEDIAKEYSEDENSSRLGGKLQWLTKQEGISSFISQAEKLKPGEISEPFKSQFGYHIITLDDYKPSHIINIKDDNYFIRQFVIQQKNMVELDRILNKLKDETYISIRLE